MIIILSQKIDTQSIYDGDEAFSVYHYPKRYRNQIKPGDTFIYYQGNRYDKSQRYYFGMGKVGSISSIDGENYYAQLVDTKVFKRKVPIYLPNGGYVEQLGYDTIRKSVNPSWQSSIRPISEEAYNYILKFAGMGKNVDEYNIQLKNAVKKYFVEKNKKALEEILDIAKRLIEIDC